MGFNIKLNYEKLMARVNLGSSSFLPSPLWMLEGCLHTVFEVKNMAIFTLHFRCLKCSCFFSNTLVSKKHISFCENANVVETNTRIQLQGFFVRKFLPKVFCTYILGLNFFWCKNIGASALINVGKIYTRVQFRQTFCAKRKCIMKWDLSNNVRI